MEKPPIGGIGGFFFWSCSLRTETWSAKARSPAYAAVPPAARGLDDQPVAGRHREGRFGAERLRCGRAHPQEPVAADGAGLAAQKAVGRVRSAPLRQDRN